MAQSKFVSFNWSNKSLAVGLLPPSLTNNASNKSDDFAGWMFEASSKQKYNNKNDTDDNRFWFP